MKIISNFLSKNINLFSCLGCHTHHWRAMLIVTHCLIYWLCDSIYFQLFQNKNSKHLFEGQAFLSKYVKGFHGKKDYKYVFLNYSWRWMVFETLLWNRKEESIRELQRSIILCLHGTFSRRRAYFFRKSGLSEKLIVIFHPLNQVFILLGLI